MSVRRPAVTRQALLVTVSGAGCLMAAVACRAPSASSSSNSWYRFTGRVAASGPEGEVEGEVRGPFGGTLLMHRSVFCTFRVHGKQAQVSENSE